MVRIFFYCNDIAFSFSNISKYNYGNKMQIRFLMKDMVYLSIIAHHSNTKLSTIQILYFLFLED